MECLSIILSAIAIIISLISIYYSNRYSHINLVHTIQELILQKSKDCNDIYEQATSNYNINTPRGTPLIGFISEIIISIQLLDNILKSYSLVEKRSFFLTQFWIQLSTSGRLYIKNENQSGGNKITQQQIEDIQKTFSPLFEKY